MVCRRVLLALEGGVPIADKELKELNVEQEDLRRAIQSRLLAFEGHCTQEIDRLRTGAPRFLEGTADLMASLLIEQGYRPVLSSEVQALVQSSIQTSVEHLIDQATSTAEQIDKLAQSSGLGDGETDARRIVRGAPFFEVTEVPASFAVGQFVPQWLLRRRLIAFIKQAYEKQLRDDLQMYAQRLQDWFHFCLMRLRETLLNVEDQSRHEGDTSRPGVPNHMMTEDISTLRNILHDGEMDHWEDGGLA